MGTPIFGNTRLGIKNNLEPQGQPFINAGRFDETTIFYIKIWFIIQLKQPFINGWPWGSRQAIIRFSRLPMNQLIWWNVRQGFCCQNSVGVFPLRIQVSCFLFTPKLGEDEAILTSIFFAWVGEKPPTRAPYPPVSPDTSEVNRKFGWSLVAVCCSTWSWPGCGKAPVEQKKGPRFVVLGFVGDEILPSYEGIIMNHESNSKGIPMNQPV